MHTMLRDAENSNIPSRIPASGHLCASLNRKILEVAWATPAVLLNRLAQTWLKSGCDPGILEFPASLTIPSGPVFFRPEPRKGQTVKSPVVKTKPKDEDKADSGDILVCRQCQGFVTTTAQRIEIQGAHAHSFTNPHGLFFDIGCFRHAPGCAYSSDSSYEFTWFAGFRWQIAACRSCMEHLGWLFTSEGSRFNGLILDKLVTLESPNEKYS